VLQDGEKKITSTLIAKLIKVEIDIGCVEKDINNSPWRMLEGNKKYTWDVLITLTPVPLYRKKLFACLFWERNLSSRVEAIFEKSIFRATFTPSFQEDMSGNLIFECMGTKMSIFVGVMTKDQSDCVSASKINQVQSFPWK
jgi:hypothetical protein